MTTAYTSLLGLALPVQGELSGTWGDTVNNSITSLLDTSVAGTTNVSTDTDVTLTTTTGAANTARQAILLFSGARTALRTVTAPAQSKIYTVINATTGGFSVKLVGSGPTTGVTIVAGESAVCAWNGSDFIKISNTGGSASFVNLTASGTVTFTGLTASQAVFTNASDELVSNAITGTGNVVMSASPTLTGTISAAAATLSGNLTLSGGTANGVAYLNGSKVVTSGSALTFDGSFANLTLTSGTSANGFLQFSNSADGGTQGYIGDSKALISGGANSSLAVRGESNILFGIASAEQMRLTSTGLGIGTSSPSTFGKLAVYGNGTAPVVGVFLGSNSPASGATLGDISFGSRTDGTVTAIIRGIANDNTNGTDGQLTFWTADNTASAAASEKMRLDSSGNLGLGVTPSAWDAAVYKALQISTNSSIASFTNGETRYSSNCFYNSSTWKYITSSQLASAYTQGAGAHTWFTAPSGTAGNAITFTQAMTLDASGNLGLGTTSINTRFHVVGLNQTNGTAEFTPNASKGSNASYVHYGTNGDWYIRSASSSGNVYIQDTGGNVGIATTTPSQKLDVVTNSNSGTAVQLSLRNTSNGTNVSAGIAFGFNTVAADPDVLATIYGLVTDRNVRNGALTFSTAASGTLSERARIDSSGQLLIGVTSLPSAGSGGAGFRADSNGRRNLYLSTSSTSNNGLIYFSNPNGEVGSITVSGSATAYNTSSDYRLKNITGALTGYKERLMSLQPKQGTWKADGSEFRGFLAHEFAEPYSASVTGEKDAVDADNKPIMQAMQASSSEVMADLVALVKEQQAIIESLKARLDAANL